MTKSDWLSIASIVMTAMTMLLSPVWAWWITSRIAQPKPNPEQKKEARLTRTKIVLRLLWPFAITVSNIIFLTIEARKKTPLTRGSVTVMCLDTLCIAIGLMLFLSAGDTLIMEGLHSAVTLGQEVQRGMLNVFMRQQEQIEQKSDSRRKRN